MRTFHVEGGDCALSVVRFRVAEAISELFEAEVVVACAEADLPFASVVGRPAVLGIAAGGAPRYVHGIVACFEQGEHGKDLTHYTVTLVPRVWSLLHRWTSRIFQDLSVPDVVQEVLRKAGVPGDRVSLHLTRSYRRREYCVQYRESDLAFVARLLEEEGIFYFFEHDEAGETLVIGDSPSAHRPIAGDAEVPFRPPSGALVAGEHVSSFRYAERIQSGRAELRDYSHKLPGASLRGAAASALDPDLEVYDYPGEYDQPGDAEPLAKIRLEELEALRRTGAGTSAVARLSPGALFTLIEHPREAFDREYLVTRVEHRGAAPSAEMTGDQAASYENRFEVVPSDAPFRPARATPRPAIKGIQTAVVVGPPGEEIHTDELGRVKVQFHWDREGKRDERSSCWLRVSQVWASPAWGAFFLPRVGHEVVVDFVEGDPDRPLVVGSVYHAANVPPYALPAEKTKSTIKSSSTPGGGGFNELRFEDKKGDEEVYLHAQKDWTIEVEHDKDQEVGRDEGLAVGRDRTKKVGRDEHETIGANKRIEVAMNHSELIGMNANVMVGMNQALTVGVNHVESVGVNRMVNVGLNASENVA